MFSSLRILLLGFFLLSIFLAPLGQAMDLNPAERSAQLTNVMSLPAAVIFDVEGTLFKPTGKDIRLLRKVMDKYHITQERWPDSEIKKHAHSEREIFEAVFGLDKWEEASDHYYELAFEDSEKPLLSPGVTELLGFLKKQGIKTATASNKKTRYIKHQLQQAGIAQYFNIIQGKEHGLDEKPSPDILVEVCRIMKINPKETWMIGDSPSDWKAGVAAGCNLIIAFGKDPKALKGNEEEAPPYFKEIPYFNEHSSLLQEMEAASHLT